MKYLTENKNKITLILFIIATFLLAIRLIFFLQDGTSNFVESILIKLIAFLSVCIIIMVLIPINMSLKNYIIKYRDVMILSIFIFYSELMFIFDNQLEFSSITIFSIIFTISIIVIIALLLPNKVKFGFMIYICVTLPIYLIGQDIYDSIFSTFFSFKEIVSVQAGLEYAEGVIHFRFIHFLFLISAVVTILLLIMYKSNNRIKLTKKTAKMFYTPLLFFLLVSLNAEYPVKSARLYLSDHYLFKSVYSNTKFVARFGSINYTVRDFWDSVIPKRVNKKDLRDIDEFFENNPKVHIDNEYTGIFEDKNFIFIAGESFDGIAVIDELTPNLAKLQNEGINFSNHYVPVYPRTTCDSEIIFNTSIIPSVTDGPTCYIFNRNSYSHSLANLFIKEGYQVDGFHSNEKEFYTRYKVYDGLGYENFYGQHELKLSETEKRYDSVFMEKGADIILKDKGKFMSFITTLSGHSPYTENHLAVQKHYEAVDQYFDNQGISVPEEVKNYIATQMELDLFVGKLLDELETKGLLDNTVILLTGDHYPYTMKNTTFEEYKDAYTVFEKSHTPLYIWSKDITPTTVEKLSSSFDLVPTIANMFNLETNYTYYFGNDVFEENYEPIVFFKDYSWYDGENYVLDGKLISGNGDPDYIQKKTESVYEYFDISIKILRTDYFAKK